MDIDEKNDEVRNINVSDNVEITRNVSDNHRMFQHIKLNVNFKIPSNSTGVLLHESNALNLLAQYSDSDDSEVDDGAKYSDSDTEEVKQIDKVNYRETKSSSSSSSESSSEEEELTVNEIKKKLEVVSDHESESDDEEANGVDKKKKKRKEPLRVKGEFLLVSSFYLDLQEFFINITSPI
mgnify:FL=1